MRNASILIGICMLAAATLTLYAQARDIAPIMKEVGPAFTALNSGMQNRSMPAADVAKNADKLQGLFKEVSAFMKEKNVADAIAWANDAAAASAALSKAAKENDADAMFTAQASIGKNCKACHAVHREQLPDKSFRMKMN